MHHLPRSPAYKAFKHPGGDGHLALIGVVLSLLLVISRQSVGQENGLPNAIGTATLTNLLVAGSTSPATCVVPIKPVQPPLPREESVRRWPLVAA